MKLENLVAVVDTRGDGDNSPPLFMKKKYINTYK